MTIITNGIKIILLIKLICNYLVQKRIVLLFFICLYISFTDNAYSQTVLKDIDSVYNPIVDSEYFEDKTNQKNIEEIKNLEFIRDIKQIYNFGFSKSSYWIRFKISQVSNDKFLINIDYPPLDKVEVFFINNTSPKGKQIIEHQKSGDSLPFYTRKFLHRNYIFNIPEETTECYIRVSSEGSVTIPLTIISEKKFFEQERKEQLILGLYYGIVLTITLYNLILFFSLREINYLFYSFYVLCYGLFQMSISGMAYELIWSASPYINSISIPFFGNFALYWMLRFSKNFLKFRKTENINEKYTKIVKIIKFTIYAQMIGTLLTLIIPYSISVKYLSFSSILSVGLIILLGIEGIKKGIVEAKYFLVAWFIFLVSVILFALKSLGFLPNNFFTSYGIQIGSAVQMLLISLAIGERLNSIKLEKEKAQIKSIESQNMAIESLKRTDKMKDEFLANTSHELRTPLNGIIGIAESLFDGVAGELNTKAKDNLQIIVASGKRLSHLINDILDFSKLKNKDLELNLKSVDLKLITDIVFIMVFNSNKNKEIEMKNLIEEDLSFVLADEDRLHQIMNNLISNAYKFTEKGFISVSTKQIDDFLEITVEDTGIGIPEDKTEDIFKPFEQVDASTSRSYGGTGIGLTITKHLIELHKGQIRVESEINKGSKFTFNLPIAKQAVNNQSTSELVSRIKYEKEEKKEDFSLNELKDENKIHILIVDDEPVNLQVLVNHLSMQNYNISQAVNGKEAVKILDSVKPDLILLDVMMPGMSGYDVSKKIREVYNSNELPIVMLTAKNLVNDLLEGFEAGANDYLTKPVSKSELLARIKTHVQLAKTNNAYRRFIPKEFITFLKRENIIDVKLGDQVQRQMTIMFSDIRSFTSISEKMSPEENFNFLNSYLSRVSPSIRKNKGFIDKYIGDGIMALFPENSEDAIKASVSMIRELEIYNKDLIKSGMEAIKIGIGLHTGLLMLGTVGEAERMEGTVISDSVNLASRLEGVNKIYGSSIIASGEVIEDAKENNHLYRFLGTISVKGKSNLIKVFEIFEGDDEEIVKLKEKTKDAFENGVNLFQEREYEEAFNQFKAVLKINKFDNAAIYYMSECVDKNTRVF